MSALPDFDLAGWKGFGRALTPLHDGAREWLDLHHAGDVTHTGTALIPANRWPAVARALALDGMEARPWLSR